MIVARYALEDDARRRASEEPGLMVERLPSERWPEYPFAVLRNRSGLEGELDGWAAELLERVAPDRTEV